MSHPAVTNTNDVGGDDDDNDDSGNDTNRHWFQRPRGKNPFIPRGYVWKNPLYRPDKDVSAEVAAILDKPGLTDEEIAEYMHGRLVPSVTPPSVERRAFYARRREIQRLAAKVESGEATIDEDYRLVENESTLPQDPLPVLNHQQQPEQQPAGNPPVGLNGGANGNGQNNANLNMDMNINMNIQQNNHPGLDNDDAERRWVEQEQTEAAEAIQRAVKRYRDEGVPEDEFELVVIPPRCT